MSRHRTVAFENPIAPDLDLELDPEKELWVPGKKKYFLPGGSTKLIELIQWDPIDFIKETTECNECERNDRLRRNTLMREYAAMICDCLPGENRFRGERAQVEVPVYDTKGTWAGIDRSTEPAFRSVRVPLEIRNRSSRFREGILYDRHDRRLID